MSAVNNCSFIGRLTSDVTLETTGGGNKLAKFSVAVQRGKDATDFIPCTAWEGTAEFLTKYFSKGSAVAVRGELRSNKVQRDGTTRTFYDVRVNDVDFVPGAGKAHSPAQSSAASYEDGPAEDEDQELPF